MLLALLLAAVLARVAAIHEVILFINILFVFLLHFFGVDGQFRLCGDG